MEFKLGLKMSDCVQAWLLLHVCFLRDVTLHASEKQTDICVGRDRHGKKIPLRSTKLEEGKVEVEEEEVKVAWEFCSNLKATSPSAVRNTLLKKSSNKYDYHHIKLHFAYRWSHIRFRQTA